MSATFEERFARWQATHQRAFTAVAKGEELEISIMDFIGSSLFAEGVTAKGVKAQLDAAPKTKVIRILIDSPGGFVHDGLAIQALLKRHPARVEVEVLGEASSAASVIAMSGDTISMHEGSTMMIHRASGGAFGTADTMRSVADALDTMTDSIADIYVARTGRSKAEIMELIDRETWMTAPEAVASGFATAIIPAKRQQAQSRAVETRMQAQASSLGTQASTPFAAMKPAERARLANTDPKGYAAARDAWEAEVSETIAKRNAAPYADRQALNARLAELTKHGIPRSAA